MSFVTEIPFDVSTFVEDLYDRYCPSAQMPDLRRLLEVHSVMVASKALATARACGLYAQADMRFVADAAMLHDIGVVATDAPGIFCHGTEPYIRHGVLGRAMLDGAGLDSRYGLVCERHTGAGLSCADIVSQNLPLPVRDMIPLSLEEKLVCYADKFFSKSATPELEKPLEKVIASMRRHGPDTLRRFMEMHALFC